MSRVLDWVLKITNVIIIVLSVIIIFGVGSMLVVTLFSKSPINEIPKDDIVYRIDVDEKVKIDDTVIHFTDLVYEKNGDMNVFYEYYDTRLWGTGWSLGTIGNISDNLGNEYFSGSGGSSAGIKSKSVRTLRDFSEQADTLIIDYDQYNRKYRVEISLKEGDKDE